MERGDNERLFHFGPPLRPPHEAKIPLLPPAVRVDRPTLTRVVGDIALNRLALGHAGSYLGRTSESYAPLLHFDL